jgi:uncharacterized protein (TIGR00299 family) protein
MLLGALIDAGARPELLDDVAARLGLDVDISVRREQRHGLSATRVVVASGDRGDRSWSAVQDLLLDSQLAPPVKAGAFEVLKRMAEAEARVHDVAPADVHLHELGAVDTLIDVCGALALLADLEIEKVACSPIPIGRGIIQTAHGSLPLPAPATVELLRGAALFGVEAQAELVTPTGAALAATLAREWGPCPALLLEGVGYGAGERELPDRPNVLRVLIGGTDAARTTDVALLETNLDDMNPELVPDAVERCFAAGALDVWTSPVQMKKGRPGIVFSALVRPHDEPAVAAAILEETSSLGVRAASMRRHELEREERSVEVGGGSVRVKLGRLNGRVVTVSPEHDDCAVVAGRTGSSVKSVWAEALAAAHRL